MIIEPLFENTGMGLPKTYENIHFNLGSLHGCWDKLLQRSYESNNVQNVPFAILKYKIPLYL